MHKLAVTVDVEDWYHVPAVTGSSFSKYATVDDFFAGWTDKYDYLTEPTHRILDLLAEQDTRATFFVVADVLDHYPGLVERIAQAGHEIACHGLHHACGIHPDTKEPLWNPLDFEQSVALAKARLEQASGQAVIGFRAPGGFVAGWMLDVLETIGFRYDSSVCLNSLYSKMPSRPEGVTTVPYHPKRGGLEVGGPRSMLEMPWPSWQILGKRLPTAGGPFLRFFGARYIAKGLKQSLRAGHSVFYFHPIDVSREDFPSGFSARRPFYWAIKGQVVQDRIRWILRRFRGQLGTCQDILPSLEPELQEVTR